MDIKKYKDIDLNNFFSFIKSNKIDLTIVSDGEGDISDLRLKYFDYVVLERAEEKKSIKGKS